LINFLYLVITGCTDGIGEEFALQLAKAKFNVVLVSRTQSKLDNLASSIQDKYSVETKTVAIDYSKATEKDFENLGSIVSQIPVRVLINNVGLSHEFPVAFHEESIDRTRDILKVNIDGLVNTTYSVLPEIIKNSKKEKGLILNMGSFSGLIPSAYLAPYSASKAFLCTFSQALGPELEKLNVAVQCTNTYFVVSKMSKIRKPTFFIPTAEKYVKVVLGKLGIPGGAFTPFTSTPYPSHALINWAYESFLSRKFWVDMSADMHRDIRKRALAKRARQAAAEAKSE
jgi:17beta-estradiol 17-dehydrogenase / very-long-chain 3-oxoacyl-CoA reductase